MLTQKTRYAILALTKLSKEFGNGPILINEIAKSELIPKRFLESILLELKKTGLLSSKLGKTGGYFLIKKPSDISLLEIIRLFEGSIAWVPCTSEKYYQSCEHCKDELKCNIRKPFKEIREFTYTTLENTNFEFLSSNTM